MNYSAKQHASNAVATFGSAQGKVHLSPTPANPEDLAKSVQNLYFELRQVKACLERVSVGLTQLAKAHETRFGGR